MDDFVFKVELVAEVRARVLRSWPNVVAMPGARTPANQTVIEPIWAEAKWPSGQPSPGQRRHGFGASRLRSIKWRRPGTGRRPGEPREGSTSAAYAVAPRRTTAPKLHLAPSSGHSLPPDGGSLLQRQAEHDRWC
jgi:hypothetical protein